MQTYQPSGAVPPIGALLTAGVSFGCAALMGIAYTMLFYYIPFVYLNFILTMGFGVVLGMIVGGLARSTKIRNPAVVTILAAAAALVGLYFDWGTTAFGIVPMGKLPETIVNLNVAAYLPSTILAIGQLLFENGAWGIKGWTVTGWPLVAFWLLEAGIILYYTVSNAREAVTKDAFCEPCQAWIPSQVVGMLQATGEEPAWENVRMGMLQSLADYPRVNGGEQFVKVTLCSCPSCQLSHFASFDASTTTVNKKGESSTSEKSIVKHLQISPDQLELVRNCGKQPPSPKSDE